MSGIQTGAGASIAISSTLPTTFDAAGFNAGTYTEIGEVTEISGDIGRTYAEVEHKRLKTRAVITLKGTYNAGQVNIVYARDDADAGQILLGTMAKSDAMVAVRITRQNGTRKYFQALVMSNPESIGDGDGMNTQATTFKVNPHSTGVDFVEAAAAT